MIYTSKIKTIVKKSSFTATDGATMHHYVVTFANGDNKNIFTTKPLIYKEGEYGTYELVDQEKNKAKFVENQPQIVDNKPQTTYTNKDQIIIRQTVIKAASDFHSGTQSTADDVVKTAQTFLNWINNG